MKTIKEWVEIYEKEQSSLDEGNVDSRFIKKLIADAIRDANEKVIEELVAYVATRYHTFGEFTVIGLRDKFRECRCKE